MNTQEQNSYLLSVMSEIAEDYPENNTCYQDNILCKYFIALAQQAIHKINFCQKYLNPIHLSETVEEMETDLRTFVSNDFSKSLQKTKIMLDLERYTDCNTVLGISILNALHDQTNPDEIISFIKSQTKDNKKIMCSVITPELTETILNF